ncbi:MAG: ABC transporter permease [Methanotrichaceae archaeon]|nr:ABC transporter permease [Methanotrichaceae archaeon]
MISIFEGLDASLDRILAVALRVIRQLKRDRRTVGLITFIPIFLMVLFGYALSGDMSGICLGLVDEGGQEGLRGHIEGVDDFEILHLGSASDAEQLIEEGRLNGAIVLGPGQVVVMLDGSSPQIATSLINLVRAGLEGPMPLDLRYIYGYDLEMMDSVGPAVLGLVVFFFTFIVSAVSFLRERTQGSLEKFVASPLSRPEMVLGYLLGFSVFTVIQSVTTLVVVVFVFGVPMYGSPITALAVVLLLGAAALVMGAFFSNFAKTEFQVVQFIPLVILPQVVLTGVWWPLQSIPESIRPVSSILPLTYSSEALRAVMLKGASLCEIMPDIFALSLFFAIGFLAATLALKREVG